MDLFAVVLTTLGAIGVMLMMGAMLLMLRHYGRQLDQLSMALTVLESLLKEGRAHMENAVLLVPALGAVTNDALEMSKTMRDIAQAEGLTMEPPHGFTTPPPNLPKLHDQTDALDVVEAVPVDDEHGPVDESALCAYCECDETDMPWRAHCHYHRCPYSVLFGCEVADSVAARSVRP